MRWFKVNEAAREIGCSESWLRRAEGKGHIPIAQRDVNGWRVYTRRYSRYTADLASKLV